jgi:hypothetical protein
MKPPSKWDNNQLVRVRVNLPRKEYEELEGMAKQEGISVTDAIRRAITSEMYFKRKTEEGCKLLYEDPRGQLFQVKIR